MSSASLKIMFIEDNPDDLALIGDLLQEELASAFNLISFRRLSEAVNYVSNTKIDFDVILVDLGLPDSQGLETFLKIKNRVKEIPIIVITGLVDETMAEQAVRQGAQDYLVKGEIDGRLLVRSIRYSIERKRAEEALRLSESAFRKLYESLRDAIATCDMEGKIIDANSNFKQLIGYDGDELSRLTYNDLAPQQWRDFEENILKEQVLGRGYSEIYEKEYRKKDGTIIPVELRTFLIQDDSGRPTGMWAVVRDITARKRGEETLLKQKEILQKIFDHIPVMVNFIDRDSRIEMVNRAWKETLGWSLEEIRQQDLDILALCYPAPQDRQRALDFIAESKGEWGDFKTRVRDGRVLDTTWANVRLADGTAIGIGQDITARKQAENAFSMNYHELQETSQRLENSRNMLQLVLESIPVRVFWKDKDLRYLGCNTLFARDAGLSRPEEILGLDDYALAWKEQAENYRADDRRIVESGIPKMNIVEPQATPTGGRIWLNTNKAPLRKPDGEIFGVLGVYEDITRSKQAEEERANLEKQFLQAQKLESLGRLAGGVAHDFNNMLGVILGYTEMALVELSPQHPIHKNLEEVRSAAHRSADLVRQLLAFARKQVVIPRALNLNDTVAGLLNMLRRLIGEDIELIWTPGHELWNVMVDPSQIDQILANLLVNARDAITGVGEVVIETANVNLDAVYCSDHPECVPGEYVLLSVSDTGFGMDQETLSQIFEPFFTSKEAGKGTGLGLATVYGIIKQNNGFIYAYSEPGQGTTFKIYLPHNRSEAVAASQELSPAAPQGGMETVLLVEDEELMLALTKASLERLGYTVLAAKQPADAIRLVKEHNGKIDLFMTDVVMPEMVGRELAERLTALQPRLKCLYMSGYTADVIAHRGILADGVCFLQKPFALKDLAEKVRKALEQ